MRSIRQLIALSIAWLILALAPAFAFTQVAGTGTGNALIGITWSGTGSVSGNTTAAAQIGDLVLLNVHNSATGTSTLNCTGDGVNTWTRAVNQGQQNGAGTTWFYAILTSPISNGTALTCTSSVSGSVSIIAVLFRPGGTAAYDTSSLGQSNSGTTVSLGPTGSLACPGNGTGCDVCVGSAVWHSSGTTSISTAGYTSLGTGSFWFAVGFKLINASNAAENFVGVNTVSANYAGALDCFKDTPAGFVVIKPMLHSTP